MKRPWTSKCSVHILPWAKPTDCHLEIRSAVMETTLEKKAWDQNEVHWPHVSIQGQVMVQCHTKISSLIVCINSTSHEENASSGEILEVLITLKVHKIWSHCTVKMNFQNILIAASNKSKISYQVLLGLVN